MAKKIAYLTVDDGPSEDMRQKVDFLVARGIPAIFFCRGDFLEARAQDVFHAIEEGFIIGNHSYDHPRFSKISLNAAYDQIRRTDDIIARLYSDAGVTRPGKFFRFPYGDKGRLTYGQTSNDDNINNASHKAALQNFLRRLGYYRPPFAGVTYRYYRAAGLLNEVDWEWTYDVAECSVYSARHFYGIDSLTKVFARMEQDLPERGCGLNYGESEDIILIHDHHQSTAMFFSIVARLQAKGLVFKMPVLRP